MNKPYGHNKLIFRHYLSKVLIIERSLLFLQFTFDIVIKIVNNNTTIFDYVIIDTIVNRNTKEKLYEISDTHNTRFDRKMLHAKTLCSFTDSYLTHT